MTDHRIHLSFAVGPVQGFVAQARRTRDLWAGSWLLSYLTECALAAAETAGGSAIIPHRDDSMRGQVTSVHGPVGGIPNRFELIFESDDKARQAAWVAESAFRGAWQSVADAVWTEYVQAIAARGKDTAEIWHRQVENFWELSWVIAAPASGEKTIGRLASARKAFRNVRTTVEHGVKCSLMGDLQEVSGHGPGVEQKAFWNEVHTRVGKHDLGDDERVCAIALVKRLFPHVIEAALDERAEKANIEMLQDQIGWSSTAFFAARPWLAAVEGWEGAKRFAERARNGGIGRGERQAAREAKLPDWAGLDATAWFANALEQNEWGVQKEALARLFKELRKLHDEVGDPPIQHYALLTMDGDSMGKLLSQLGDPSKLSECLGRFAGQVEGIVSQYGGRTIYAGGDDVLAMLPARGALQAATDLARAYTQSFENTATRSDTTLSGAIVFAPWKFSLRQVLKTGHHLLDEVAKERTGRDALVIGILQSSGLNAVWSAPWSVVRGERQGVPPLDDMLEAFGTANADQEKAEFNASYLYRLREQFGRLLGDFREEPGHFEKLPEDLSTAHGNDDDASLGLLGDIAHAEHRRRMSKEERKRRPPEDTRKVVEKLMALSRKWDRDINRQQLVLCDPRTFSFDGWRVARFLKQIQEGKATTHD